MKIYTRKGDKGYSSTITQTNISKSDDVFELLGSLDEVSAFLSLANVYLETGRIKSFINQIQNELILLCEEIAGGEKRLNTDCIKAMEKMIDDFIPQNSVFKCSALISDNPASAVLNIARTAVRRAERTAVRMKTDIIIVTYLNRLSDLLYAFSAT